MAGATFGRKVDTVALARLIEESGVSFRQNKRSFIFTCPRCGKKDKLMMFKSDGRFVCWVCAETSSFKGRPELALTELLGMAMPRIREKIYGDSFADTDANYFELSLWDFYGDDPPPQELIRDLKGKPWPLDFFPIDHQHSAKGLAYLQSRGVGLELAMQYKLRYCPVQKRVIFPCYVGEKLVGWQARYILPHEWFDEETGVMVKIPKILTTGPRDDILMFQDRLTGSDHAIICEGPVDALKCHLAGGNVATMGKVVSQRQIDIIKGSGVKRVYLALDLDAGTESMKLLTVFNDYINLLTSPDMFELYKLQPAPGYEDLGAMPVEAVKDSFSSAERLRPGSLFLGLGA